MIKELLSNIAKEWLKPRTIFATAFYFTFCYLTYKGTVSVETFMTVFSGMVTYYYANKNTQKPQ